MVTSHPAVMVETCWLLLLPTRLTDKILSHRTETRLQLRPTVASQRRPRLPLTAPDPVIPEIRRLRQDRTMAILLAPATNREIAETVMEANLPAMDMGTLKIRLL